MDYHAGMSLRVSDLRLPVEEPEATLPSHLARVLGVAPGDLARWRILRKSLDTVSVSKKATAKADLKKKAEGKRKRA